MKCRPAPLTTTQRSDVSAARAAVCATSASIIVKSSVLSDSGRLSVSVATGPVRSSRTDSDIGRANGGWLRRVETRVPSGADSRKSSMQARALRRRGRSRGTDSTPRARPACARSRPARGGRIPRWPARMRDRRSRAPNGSSTAAGRARACARPARRPRTRRCGARCRIRSPGSSTPRSAARERNCSVPQ